MFSKVVFGIPREGGVQKGIEEKRVGLSPPGVRELVDLGASVLVASDAGIGAGFRNVEYRSAGAQVVYSNEEVIRRAQVIVQAGRPNPVDWDFYEEGATLFSFLHLGVPDPRLIKVLLERRISAVGYELVQEPDGSLPILQVSSEIAGRMAVQIAGRLLENTSGGRGVLLGGIPGIPPADVVIIGGGTVGYFAARSFLGMGASVYVLDENVQRLRQLDKLFQGRVVTAVSNQSNIEKHVAFSDVLITCALTPGKPAPVLVTEKMVERMHPGSVILDYSIDQGGCVETSRLNPGSDYLFKSHDIVHFCAPNVPAMVARTSTHGLTNALLPYLRGVTRLGALGALKQQASLTRGLYTFGGRVSERLPVESLPSCNLEQLVNEMD